MAQLIHQQLQKYVNSLTEPSDGKMKFGRVKEKISDERVDDVENNNYCRQAGAELGQAQIQLELGFTSIKIRIVK